MGMLVVLTPSCEKDKDAEPATISDKNFYGELGNALIHCFIDIYNQNLAGKPTGTQYITASGPMGGTVIITGTTSYDNTHGITTTNLVFEMTDVAYTYSTTSTSNVTLTGAITYTGSFSDSYTSVNHQSDNLHINGSVTHDGIVRTINMSGEVSINRSSTTTVNIFGYTVSW